MQTWCKGAILKMLDDLSISEALRTLREYAATETDYTRLSDLIMEVNTILDVLDLRVDGQSRKQ
jgi:hypothetical protein